MSGYIWISQHILFVYFKWSVSEFVHRRLLFWFFSDWLAKWVNLVLRVFLELCYSFCSSQFVLVNWVFLFIWKMRSNHCSTFTQITDCKRASIDVYFLCYSTVWKLKTKQLHCYTPFCQQYMFHKLFIGLHPPQKKKI